MLPPDQVIEQIINKDQKGPGKIVKKCYELINSCRPIQDFKYILLTIWVGAMLRSST